MDRRLKYAGIAIATATMLVIVANVASFRVAALIVALSGLVVLFFWDRRHRRKWEKDMRRHVEKMREDYNRVLRDVARSRTDVELIRKTLGDAGSAARGYGRDTQNPSAEQRMVRALIDTLTRLQDDNRTDLDMPLPDQWQTINIHQLSDQQVLALVRSALAQDRIDVFLQPIVSLPQRKPRFYEMLSRIAVRPDAYVTADRYIGLAASAGLLPAIDNLVLLSGLKRLSADEDASRGFFCNVTSLTLNDPKFMSDLIEFIALHRDLAPRLVFELAQQDLTSMNADMRPVLHGLARLGCRFSMDQVERIAFDISDLESLSIRFIKIDARLLLSRIASGGMMALKRLKAELDRSGIDIVITHVETERQLSELSDLEIDFGQGYLFARPEIAT